METTLATQQDLKDMGIAIRHDMAILRQEVKQEIVLSEQRMTIKLGTIVSVAIGAAVALTKLMG